MTISYQTLWTRTELFRDISVLIAPGLLCESQRLFSIFIFVSFFPTARPGLSLYIAALSVSVPAVLLEYQGIKLVGIEMDKRRYTGLEMNTVPKSLGVTCILTALSFLLNS